ncbi:hypothetical protein IGI04_009532 [Brassica rapa subsp. trilocularis]|uniref:F-box associated beta-propeller type 1 domain-containing protein n=1 Tax=Brassica rapa subsp. trilocularis TaxID=1813537 RepID=A0ABQ7MXK5_BRACM|nr:hypothetical protein IGI04_009532 [Brassica rapa subsp. trilocularis]
MDSDAGAVYKSRSGSGPSVRINQTMLRRHCWSSTSVVESLPDEIMELILSRLAVKCLLSCDGLICLFSHHTPNMVANPATGWHQCFPLSRVQQLLSNMCITDTPNPQLGFGKDKFTGTYKPVWLCNSAEFGRRLDNTTTTTCEVFDFSTNAWRYLFPASSYRILDDHKPVYFDGSLYWLTECAKVLSFDLHTETFQVICQAPFSIYLNLSKSICASSTTACAYPKETGPPN